jgi:CubicO group peptidase (beta-lactamase class C family)
MKALFVLGLAFLISACQPESPSTAASQSQARLVDKTHIDEVLQSLVHEQGLVGVSALIYEQGEEAYFGAFGFADREAQRAMERNTLVRLYSMTKPITGVALMILYEEGRFQLDDPLSKYLPEYADMQAFVTQEDGPNFIEPSYPIKVYDILRHTAGFVSAADDSVPGKLYAQLDPFNHENTLAEMSQKLAQVPLLHQPGKQWVYGPGTDVQARLVEVLSGQKFENFLLERIFLPLKMYETGHYLGSNQRDRFAALYQWTGSSMERASDEIAYSDYYQVWPLRRGGTGLVSTLDDYMRFARMLTNGGELDGVRILKPETIKLMATNALPDTVTDLSWLPSKGRVGFGINFAVRHSPPASAEEASGAVGEFFWDGFANTLFWVDPKNQITAVLFTQYIPFGPVELHKPFRDAVYYRDAEARAPKAENR